MLGMIQKLVPLPDGGDGLALEANRLRVVGVSENETAAYLEQVRAAWPNIVREDALAALYRNGSAALRAIREELAEAQEAEELGVPPPGGRSSAELEQVLAASRTAFKSVYAAVQNAATVTEINTALQNAHDQGLTWLVPDDWEPYPEECPWVVAT